MSQYLALGNGLNRKKRFPITQSLESDFLLPNWPITAELLLNKTICSDSYLKAYRQSKAWKPHVKIDLKLSSLFRAPHAFISKAGEAVMISLLKREEDAALLEMYLVYEPRNSFSGLPPIEDGACVMWVKHMVEQGINLRATSFKHGLVGHTALFSMPQSKCEMLVVVAPGHQAMGIGTELTRCAIELAHETGFDEMWLSVEARNHMARHMYAKCGFQRLRQYGDDDVEMTYDLARHHRVQSNSIAEFVREAASVDMRTTCAEAAELIIRHHVSALPAVDGDGRVIGIVAATDLLSAANPRELVTSVVT
ncbi:MAG: GNAT family N-acetyltransferase, partial [Deltaproteobacteria bacterium]|nr:GNAT family N-acetyltransferase [Deltaproteobacteria bacterium]